MKIFTFLVEIDKNRVEISIYWLEEHKFYGLDFFMILETKKFSQKKIKRNEQQTPALIANSS